MAIPTVQLTATTAAELSRLKRFATDGAFEADKGSAGAQGDVYYNTTQDQIRAVENSTWYTVATTNLLGRGAWVNNLGFAAATTSTTSDTLRITGATAALSSTNPLFIAMNGAVAGQVDALTATADVSILLTGAQWGLDTLGDFTDVELRVYAINDAGALKWGVSLWGGYTSISQSETDVLPGNITAKQHMLVNTGLTAATTCPCVEVGWIKANWDDAGTTDDCWEIQNGAGDLNIGVPVPTLTNWIAWTPTGAWDTHVTYTGRRRRVGEEMEFRVLVALSGAPNSATLTINLPTGYKIDTNALLSTSLRGVDVGTVIIRDNSGATYEGAAIYSSTTAVEFKYMDDAAAGVEMSTAIDATHPISFDTDDYITVTVSVPIVTWSA